MAPSEKSNFKSSLGMSYPDHRDDPLINVDLWLEDRRKYDGAEGLWRIHDEIYDFSSWIESHPGGQEWLSSTKGTDITEAFESHHISTLAEEMLSKFYVRKARTPRNYPYTFREDGFYKTVKKKVRNVLKDVPDKPRKMSKLMTDCLFLAYISCALLAVKFDSLIIATASGIFLALTVVAAHNFFHQKDNFRMFYFDFCLLSSRYWRISHALSHHLYTNSVFDMELSFVEPFLQYLPKEKHIIQRITSIIISPGVYLFAFLGDYVLRMTAVCLKITKFRKTDVLPFLVPLFMYIVGDKSLLYTIFIWFWIISCASFHFGLVGLNAAHHHPNIFHDGDTPREDKDWGLFQLDAVMDRHEINNSRFLVLTNFGDHTLHHLFPTVDHGHLPYLYPVFKETCKEFGIKFRVTSQIDLVIGQFMQLLRVRPNPKIPGSESNKKINSHKTFYERWKPYINVN